jgi:hypothetical protein
MTDDVLTLFLRVVPYLCTVYLVNYGLKFDSPLSFFYFTLWLLDNGSVAIDSGIYNGI